MTITKRLEALAPQDRDAATALLREYARQADATGASGRKVFAALADVLADRFDVPAFVAGYIDAILFAESGPDTDLPLHRLGYTVAQFSDEAMARVRKDCATFIASNLPMLEAFCEGRDESQAGRDFWLSRTGSGTGFWCRGDDEACQRLETAAQTVGEAWVQVDDGKIDIY